MKYKIFFSLLFSTFLWGNEVDPNILIGKFNPEKTPNFVNLKNYKIPVKNNNLYLQKEAAEALQKLYFDFKREHPNVEFWITSATRTYWDQKAIWEKKWNYYKNLKEEDKVKKILEYSSMPATSRHHWGTDFDINILENLYYEKGQGKTLWEWLKKNSHKYGFCLPYNENRTSGYFLEKWHWSYKPISSLYLKKWNELFSNKQIKNIDFSGSKYFEIYAPLYVNSINEECF